MTAGKTILIIEDDNFSRDVYEEILIDSGFNVETAVDGEEGLAKAQKGGFDLILLDVMMPKKNGLEVLEGLKNNPPSKQNGPIILLTNLAHDPIVKDALEKGATNYLIKADLNPDQLVVYVKQFLES